MTTTLSASRELDALIAEKVMGARVTWEPDIPMIQAAPGEWGNPRDQPRAVFAPRYSTSIEAAWQVVEQVSNRGYLVTVQCVEFVSSSADAWVVCCAGTGKQAVTVRAESAPLAICRAALAAVGHDS